MGEKQENYFETLNNVDVSDKIEKKNGSSYLSWAYAWGEVKKRYPDANYKVYENAEGWNYHTDGRSGWVKTGVTIAGIEHIEFLPVMDNRNRSISLESITSFDVNKAIQRSLTKAIARHGLGLYIFAGEDLPEAEKEQAEKDKAVQEAELKAKVMSFFTRHKFDKEKLETIANAYKIKDVKEMTAEHCKHYIATLEKKGGRIDE